MRCEVGYTIQLKPRGVFAMDCLTDLLVAYSRLLGKEVYPDRTLANFYCPYMDACVCEAPMLETAESVSFHLSSIEPRSQQPDPTYHRWNGDKSDKNAHSAHTKPARQTITWYCVCWLAALMRRSHLQSSAAIDLSSL